jgi:hypothetical protein
MNPGTQQTLHHRVEVEEVLVVAEGEEAVLAPGAALPAENMDTLVALVLSMMVGTLTMALGNKLIEH